MNQVKMTPRTSNATLVGLSLPYNAVVAYNAPITYNQAGSTNGIATPRVVASANMKAR